MKTLSIAQLQGSLACTDWEVFEGNCSDLDVVVNTVSEYINLCADGCIPEKAYKVYDNKPWVTKELCAKRSRQSTSS